MLYVTFSYGGRKTTLKGTLDMQIEDLLVLAQIYLPLATALTWNSMGLFFKNSCLDVSKILTMTVEELEIKNGDEIQLVDVNKLHFMEQETQIHSELASSVLAKPKKKLTGNDV